MVSKRKKSTKKVQGTTEPIEEDIIVMPFFGDAIPEVQSGDATILLTATENVDEPKVQIIDETSKLLNLLNDSPKVPLIRTLEEATIFVDKYRVWKRDVRTATR